MKLLIAVISLFAGLFANAQENLEDSTTSCIAKWQMGDNKILSITHIQRKFRSGKLSSILNLTYEAHISVINSTETGDTIQWTFHLSEKFKKENPDYEKTMQVYNGMKMVYVINKSGSFRELINWEEVKDAYVKMFEASLPTELSDSTKAIINKTYSLFNSKEMVESALIREILVYHSPYGGNYSTKEKIIPVTFPNPFGGDPLPALFTQQITGFNLQPDYFKVVLKQEMDSLAIKGLMTGIINKMNLSSDTAINEMKKQLSDFKINDLSEFDVLQPTGWISRVLRVRTAITTNTKEIDSYIMKIQ